MKIFLAFLCIPLLLSCNESTQKPSSQKTIILPAEPSTFVTTKDCYEDRNTIKIVGTRSATVIKAGKFGILDCQELGERYQTCELPDWAIEGSIVRFSGVVKEVFENERLAGTPFLLNEINRP